MRKIDIFVRYGVNKWFDYHASTMKAKTCKEARARFLALHSLKSEQVKVSFSK
jgi:hypothetical protein